MDPSVPGFPSAQGQEAGRASDSRTEELRIIFIALIPAAIMAVMLRFISRRMARMRIWWDDYLTVVALAFATALNVDLLMGTFHGLGEHVEFAGMDGVLFNGKSEYFAEVIYMIAMAAIKISILLFYYRLFNADPRFCLAVWVISTVVVCWYVTSTLVAIFQCQPIPYFWNRTIPGGQCISVVALWWGNSISSLVTDASILCLPLPIIWRMNVTPRQKVAISAMFLLGACVCITSILRLFTVHSLSALDPTFTTSASALWTSVECSTAVIAGCLPTYKPLFNNLLAPISSAVAHHGRKNRRNTSITSLTPLSALDMQQQLRDAEEEGRKYSDYSVVSPKAPARGMFRERRIENVGAGLAAGGMGMRSVPCFQEVDFGPGSRSKSRGLGGAAVGGSSSQGISPGQRSAGTGAGPSSGGMVEVRNGGGGGWVHGPFGGKLVGGSRLAGGSKREKDRRKASVKTVRLSEYVVGGDDGLGVLTKEIMKL